MDFDIDKLPDDPAELKNILSEVTSQYEEQKEKYEKQLEEERLRNQYLEEKLKVFRKRFLGKKSEKLTEEEKLQLRLFNEAESIVDKEEAEQAEEERSVAVKGHTRRKRGRKPLPDYLPREEKIYDLSDEEKKCSFCGEMRPCIGSDSTEELDFIPAQIKVIKHTRLKYGPCKCEAFRDEIIPEVKSAPGPVRLIRNSIVSPGLLSYVLVSKYVDALPFNRQSKMFSRIDIEISKATMCNWAILAAERCKGLFDLMWEEARTGPFIQMDETSLQVLKEPGRDPTSKSQMWVAIGYPEYGRPIVLYNYRTSRSKDVPVDLLSGYKGYLQTDGYAGYNEIGSDEGIIHVGCFAHARRCFHDAFKLSKKLDTGKRGLSFIKELYQIERETREKYSVPDEFNKVRKEKVEPVLNEFYKWLQIKVDSVAPASKAGEAIKYTLNEWNKLIRYIEHYYLTPDNNAVERAIRPFVIGRKNWLFSNTPRGAHSSAIIYSLVETAKANKLEPSLYLRYLFTHLPYASSNDDLKKLLPTQLVVEDIIRTKD